MKKCWRIVASLVIVIASLLLFALPVQADTLYEYYTEDANSHDNVWQGFWTSQTFTPSQTHEITFVRLLLSKYGTQPAILKVSIRNTDPETGKPTGSDLCFANFDTSVLTSSPVWYQISFTSGPILKASTKYAIVAGAMGGGVNDRIEVKLDSSSPTYDGGNQAYSQNQGSSWTISNDEDLVFEEWGNPIFSPTLTTNSASEIEITSATLSGNITDTGGDNADERGFEWGTETGVYTDNWTEEGDFGIDEFTHSLTDLLQGTTYYYRTMANNSAGWGYGEEESFTTLVPSPYTGLYPIILAMPLLVFLGFNISGVFMIIKGAKKDTVDFMLVGLGILMIAIGLFAFTVVISSIDYILTLAS